ncbi:MAG: hypothetical protein HWN81_15365 [Candidatus Lokiarchaeota archaeon]|nr:hypothetical protein [Candidatus Lokiarchaeota archaeon]
MGKGSGLAIIALIIGIGGLGFGIYSVIILPDTIIQQASEESAISQIWTVEQPSVYYATSSYYDIPDMDITINVNTGESVLILFNGEFTADVGVLIGGVRLMLDNVEIPGSRREFNIETSVGVLMGYSITTHVLIDDLVAGEYEIEVQAFGFGTSERIDDGLLTLFTFK